MSLFVLQLFFTFFALFFQVQKSICLVFLLVISLIWILIWQYSLLVLAISCLILVLFWSTSLLPVVQNRFCQNQILTKLLKKEKYLWFKINYACFFIHIFQVTHLKLAFAYLYYTYICIYINIYVIIYDIYQIL